MIRVNTYDLDGVVLTKEPLMGLVPGVNDLIVTGRSFTQKEDTLRELRSKGIKNFVFFNKLSRSDDEYGRVASGEHKADVLIRLRDIGVDVVCHYEDDPLQKQSIERELKKADMKTQVILIGTWS